MPKPPTNIPAPKDRVKARGRDMTGLLLKVDDRLWAHVQWDHNKGPRACHLHERGLLRLARFDGWLYGRVTFARRSNIAKADTDRRSVMDRSMIDAIRLSDIPTNLAALIQEWLTRFCSPYACVQPYFFEGSELGKCEQRVAIYTDNQQYMIHAKWGEGTGYLGCIARARKSRAGEEHQRGSDLADGPFTYGTWFRILGDILSYEMVSLAKTSRPVPDGHQFPSEPLAGQQAAG